MYIKHNIDEVSRKLESIIQGGQPALISSAMDGLEEAGNYIVDAIKQIEGIPKEWLGALNVARVDSEELVLIGPVYELKYLKDNKGTRYQILLSRCPKQKYFEGFLKKPVESMQETALLEPMVRGNINTIKQFVVDEVSRLIKERLT